MMVSRFTVGIAASVFTASVSAAAYAGTCTISTNCQAQDNCIEDRMTLAWSESEKAEIVIDGLVFPAQRFAEPTTLDEIKTDQATYEIKTVQPMIVVSQARKQVVIAASDVQGEITLTAVTMPQRYADYDDALNGRVVLSGICEGLF